MNGLEPGLFGSPHRPFDVIVKSLSEAFGCLYEREMYCQDWHFRDLKFIYCKSLTVYLTIQSREMVASMARAREYDDDEAEALKKGAAEMQEVNN